MKKKIKSTKGVLGTLWGIPVQETFKVNTSDIKASRRKATPIFTGVLSYFPDALAEVCKASLAGNKQHLDGEPLHWDRSKSKDQMDSLTRHLIDCAKGIEYDDDGVRHLAKVCWRGLAQLQLLIEKENENKK